MAHDQDHHADNVIPFPGAMAQDAAGLGAFGVERRQPEPRAPRADPATYRIRVDLDGASPPIWRRLELDSDLTLFELHEIVQVAMGWTNSHLHHFEMGPRRDHQVLPFLNDFDVKEGEEGIRERDVRLDQVLSEVGEQLFYEYDFGDGWERTIQLEAVTPYDVSTPRARCTAGQRACPPEDCGGIGGYAELLEGLAHPESADEWLRERLDWMPKGFDPAAFSVEETNDPLDTTLAESTALAAASTMDLDENLTDLLARSRANPGIALTELLTAATLSASDVPDPGTQERMVRPWLHLMGLIGEDGLKLTQAGYLAPAVVVELARVLGLDESRMGKMNREEHAIPVADLRESAVAQGLVRKLKGRLLVTRNGKRLASDPQALWWHVAGSLPLGRDFERHAGVVALLATAAGGAPGAAVRRHGPEVLGRAGWWIEGGLRDWDAYHAARPTLAVLRLTGASAGRTAWDDGPATEEGRRFARAALRSRRGRG